MDGRTVDELNTCQRKLLSKHVNDGLTVGILMSWQPESQTFVNLAPAHFAPLVDNDNNAPHPQRALEPLAFEQAHADAVTMLIHKHGFSAQQAVDEVSGINANEARFLSEFYDGKLISGATLRSNDADATCMDNPVFHQMFAFLVKKKHYTYEAALDELADLSPDKVLMLKHLFDEGLRGEHLRRLIDSNKSHLVFDNYGDHPEYRRYFNKVFAKLHQDESDINTILINAVIQCAFDVETNEMTSFFGRRYNPKVKFLNTHLHQGIGPNDMPKHFTPQHHKTYAYLRFKGFKPRMAILELKHLSAALAKVLRDYYSYGVRAKDLISLSEQSPNCVQHRIKALSTGNSSLGAVKLLQGLNEWQGRLLETFHKKGLTKEDVIALGNQHPQFKGFSDTHFKAVKYQVEDNCLDIFSKIGSLMTLSQSDIEEIIVMHEAKEVFQNSI